ncbi:MAG: holo-ACP synthase [Acidobacteriia bacterium]|nr:holo-ACP synthase [Terriglobia bacterium]
MIRIYQGIDVVAVEKIRGVVMRHEGFLSDVFGEEERTYCFAQAEPYTHLAGRFAAKEAAMKALGIGITGAGAGGGLGDVEVARHPSGRPTLTLSGWAAKVARGLGVTQSSVSISHSEGVAVAAVVLVAAREE